MDLDKRHQPLQHLVGLVVASAALVHETEVRHAGFHVEVKVDVMAEEWQQQVFASLAVLGFVVLVGVARVALKGETMFTRSSLIISAILNSLTPTKIRLIFLQCQLTGRPLQTFSFSYKCSHCGLICLFVCREKKLKLNIVRHYHS